MEEEAIEINVSKSVNLEAELEFNLISAPYPYVKYLEPTP